MPSHNQAGTGLDPQAVISALRRCKVGADFWAEAATLPHGRDVILCPSSPEALQGIVEAARGAGVLHRAVVRGKSIDPALPGWGKAVDPWQACEAAAMVIADANEEWALVAALSRCPLLVVGEGPFSALSPAAFGERCSEDALQSVVRDEVIGRWRYIDPFSNAPTAATTIIEMMGDWRRTITVNRDVSAIFGVAAWKRVATDALLWDGRGPVRYARPTRNGGAGLPHGALALAWMARTDAKMMNALARAGVRVGEIEDGMIRSNGLGANCVPPLSIVVDSQGPHFDPSRPSELEDILQTAEIGADLCVRAAGLRETIVQRGIGKYGQWHVEPAVTGAMPARRVVLVTGQVEDDRSILCGGAGLDNLELLRRARALEPDAWIVFKPHPDVEAGHRKGHVPDAKALCLADEIDRTSSISALLGLADAVHV
ncbi:MAG: beta-3-deoxy-D-manno-oct-2-ulosonic acid transferase, partial [Pseudomonadota bacterium]